MIIFIAITAALAVLTVVWVIRPLLRSTAGSGVSSERLNASIYRDQLNALDRDLARGLMSVADHEATKDELQLRLLDDVAAQLLLLFFRPRHLRAAVRAAQRLRLGVPFEVAAAFRAHMLGHHGGRRWCKRIAGRRGGSHDGSGRRSGGH